MRTLKAATTLREIGSLKIQTTSFWKGDLDGKYSLGWMDLFLEAATAACGIFLEIHELQHIGFLFRELHGILRRIFIKVVDCIMERGMKKQYWRRSLCIQAAIFLGKILEDLGY